jgi:phage-related baseplate assembly protein
MASRFTAVDLSQLPPPQLIEELDYEAVLAAAKAYVLVVWEAVRARRPDLPPLDTLDLEQEPIAIVLQALAYRELLLRALVNDKARAVLLAKAVGTDLEHIGVFFGVSRMPAVENPRGTSVEFPQDFETDDRLRRRIQLAPEAFSVAGPAGAYEFHAITLSIDIDDAHAFSPEDGHVTLVLAGKDGEPVSDGIIAAVTNRLARDDVRPLTDVVVVRRADIVTYDVALDLKILRGPDPVLIALAAETSIRKYAAERYRIGAEVYRAGIIAAAKVAGVEDVTTNFADVICGDTEIPVLGDVPITTTIL